MVNEYILKEIKLNRLKGNADYMGANVKQLGRKTYMRGDYFPDTIINQILHIILTTIISL